MPDDLALQIEPLHELIRAYGWPLLMIAGVEADDVIGTLVRRAEAEGFDVVISTGDKDLAQLITPRVTLVNTMSNEKLDMQSVVAKFGVRADQILDLLTLTGDAVDNVPGVAKVGPKTAAKWLAEYGTLDQVIAHAGDIGGVVGENLRAALDWLPQGRKLLTVKTDCTLPVTPTGLGRAAGRRRQTERALRALRVQELAQGPRRWRDATAQNATAQTAAPVPAESTRRRSPQRALRCRDTTRPYWTCPRSSAGSMRSSTPSWSASTPRRPASIRCRRASSACRSRSSPDTRPTFRSRTAMRARRRSCRSTRCSRG